MKISVNHCYSPSDLSLKVISWLSLLKALHFHQREEGAESTIIKLL